MDQIKIGKFIAQLRKEKNMTQADLGNKIGVSYKTISKWENRKRHARTFAIKTTKWRARDKY